MSNLSNRSEQNPPEPAFTDPTRSAPPPVNSERRYPVDPYRGRGDGIKGFFLGVLFTLLLGAAAGGAYWFAQRQAASNQASNPSAPDSAPDATTLPAPPAPPTNLDTDSATGTGAPTTTEPDSSPDTTGLTPLNLQANHANGSTLRVTGVSVGDGIITLKMVITNGHDEPIKLQDKNSPAILKDDLGNVYNLVAPPDNPNITVNPNTTVRGDFVFSGQLAPNATTLTLLTNSKFGGDASFSKDPKFAIANIPAK